MPLPLIVTIEDHLPQMLKTVGHKVVCKARDEYLEQALSFSLGVKQVKDDRCSVDDVLSHCLWSHL